MMKAHVRRSVTVLGERVRVRFREPVPTKSRAHLEDFLGLVGERPGGQGRSSDEDVPEFLQFSVVLDLAQPAPEAVCVRPAIPRVLHGDP